MYQLILHNVSSINFLFVRSKIVLKGESKMLAVLFCGVKTLLFTSLTSFSNTREGHHLLKGQRRAKILRPIFLCVANYGEEVFSILTT